jgi:hypothetical protein
MDAPVLIEGVVGGARRAWGKSSTPSSHQSSTGIMACSSLSPVTAAAYEPFGRGVSEFGEASGRNPVATYLPFSPFYFLWRLSWHWIGPTDDFFLSRLQYRRMNKHGAAADHLAARGSW